MQLIIDFDLNKRINRIQYINAKTIKEIPIDPEDFDFDDIYDLVNDIIDNNI